MGGIGEIRLREREVPSGVYSQVLTRCDRTGGLSSVCRIQLCCTALRAGDDVDLVRESMHIVLQALLEVEGTEAHGRVHERRHRQGSPSTVAERSPAWTSVTVGGISRT